MIQNLYYANNKQLFCQLAQSYISIAISRTLPRSGFVSAQLFVFVWVSVEWDENQVQP